MVTGKRGSKVKEEEGSEREKGGWRIGRKGDEERKGGRGEKGTSKGIR